MRRRSSIQQRHSVRCRMCVSCCCCWRALISHSALVAVSAPDGVWVPSRGCQQVLVAWASACRSWGRRHRAGARAALACGAGLASLAPQHPRWEAPLGGTPACVSLGFAFVSPRFPKCLAVSARPATLPSAQAPKASKWRTWRWRPTRLLGNGRLLPPSSSRSSPLQRIDEKGPNRPSADCWIGCGSVRLNFLAQRQRGGGE